MPENPRFKYMTKLIVLTILISFIAAFLRYGRSIYMPLIHKVKGKETVESVIEKKSENVLQRLKKSFEIVGLDTFPQNLTMLALKEEQKLQLFTTIGSKTTFIKEYP